LERAAAWALLPSSAAANTGGGSFDRSAVVLAGAAGLAAPADPEAAASVAEGLLWLDEFRSFPSSVPQAAKAPAIPESTSMAASATPMRCRRKETTPFAHARLNLPRCPRQMRPTDQAHPKEVR
jgi:hypothetical protein